MTFLQRAAATILLLLSAVSAWILYRFNDYPDLAPYQQYFVNQSGAERQGDTLSATFLGTTTILLSDGETSIMTDGFFTRPSLGALLLGNLSPDRQLIETALEKANVKRLAAVIPVHSHHDHAMDAPEVARQTGALLVGSESTANIGRGWGLPERQILIAKSGEPLSFGKFRVTLLRSKHAPMPAFVAGLSGHGEEITTPLQYPASITDYKEGGSYSVVVEHPLGNVLIQGSAGFTENLLNGFHADTVFLGIAGLSKVDREYRKAYFKETVLAVGATRVIPIHWDDFTRPYSKPLQPFSRVINDFDTEINFVLEQARLSGDITVQLLPMWGRIRLNHK